MGKRFRILVVEDDPEVSYFLKAALNTNNFEGCVADNGLKALEFFDSQDFDAILMDINLPLLNGIEATRKIRAQAKGAEIPIIILTALDMTEWEEQSKAAGASLFLVKPFRSKDVLHCLRTLLESPKHAASPTTTPKTKKATHLQVTYKTPQGLIQCYLQNLMDGRSYLKTKKILPLGSTFNFEIQIEGRTEKPLHVKATVKWINLYSGQEGMGIEYQFEGAEDEKRILDLMSSLT